MSASVSGNVGTILWKGKPWVTPAATARTVVVGVVAVAAVLLELLFAPSDVKSGFLGLPLVVWTVIVFFLIWAFSLLHLLLLWVSNTYVLRNDGLEIRTGILTSTSFVVAASGFADMEVTKSIIGRILNYGSIIIRTQDETRTPDKVMQKIRNPMTVGAQIRQVMSRPIVRIDGQVPPEPKR